MKRTFLKILIMTYILSAANQSVAKEIEQNDKTCNINLWDQKSVQMDIYKLILISKGYNPVFDNSADLSLSVNTAGFAETGCDDGSFIGNKNFSRTNAYAELIYKNNRTIDSIYGSDIQTASTTFNADKIENKRIVCADYNIAMVSAVYKIMPCYRLKQLIEKN